MSAGLKLAKQFLPTAVRGLCSLVGAEAKTRPASWSLRSRNEGLAIVLESRTRHTGPFTFLKVRLVRHFRLARRAPDGSRTRRSKLERTVVDLRLARAPHALPRPRDGRMGSVLFGTRPFSLPDKPPSHALAPPLALPLPRARSQIGRAHV